MSEFDGPRWLRDELKRHLAPVHTPELLWERIQAGSARQRRVAVNWARWPVAAILTVGAALGSYWLPSEGRVTQPAIEAASATDSPMPTAEWDLRCAPPSGRASFYRANLALRRGHPLRLTASVSEDGSNGCQTCHVRGLTQHHL